MRSHNVLLWMDCLWEVLMSKDVVELLSIYARMTQAQKAEAMLRLRLLSQEKALLPVGEGQAEGPKSP